MVKQGTFPRGFIVTTVAFLAFLALVHVIPLVARVTGLAQVFLAKDALVTGSTFNLIVFTP